jgi:hypothetical protein
LFLALLTPGIPEYLSGSSAFAAIVLNPFWFVLGLSFNLAMYLPGVLLIREAQVRWGKGWATVFTLGAAYAIVEEGIGLSTMFYPLSSAAGPTGSYGHALGVNWVWVPEVMLVHMVLSIGIPLLLFGFVYPEYRNWSLLTRRGILAVAVILAVDVTILAAVLRGITHYWMGDSVLLGSLGAVAGLCLLAYLLPRNLVQPRPGPVRWEPRTFAFVGAGFTLGLLELAGVLESWHLPAVAVALSIPAFAGSVLWLVLTRIGDRQPERSMIALSLGVIVPILLIGVITQLELPFVLAADLVVVLFYRHLFRRFPAPTPSAEPRLAIASRPRVAP